MLRAPLAVFSLPAFPKRFDRDHHGPHFVLALSLAALLLTRPVRVRATRSRYGDFHGVDFAVDNYS
jgi:hypothetical protein